MDSNLERDLAEVRSWQRRLAQESLEPLADVSELMERGAALALLQRAQALREEGRATDRKVARCQNQSMKPTNTSVFNPHAALVAPAV